MFLPCLLVALLPLVQACLNSGVCGGCQQSCGGCQPVQQCQPASCQPGYSCGSYGCARNRARSALTKQVDGLFLEDKKEKKSEPGKNNIFGLRRHSEGRSEAREERTPVDNGTLARLTNPNFIFRQCCEQRGLPDACLHKCHFNTYTRDALQSMLLKTDPCPVEAAADMQFCAAQGLDHRECCSRNGVATTLAGPKCLLFCDQRPNKVTKLDYSYVPCYDRFEQMKRCFFDEIKTKAEEEYGKL